MPNRFYAINNSNSDSAAGKLFQMIFTGNGTIRDQWISNSDNVILSHQVPQVSPWECRLVGIAFTNSNQNADPIIKIAVIDFRIFLKNA